MGKQENTADNIELAYYFAHQKELREAAVEEIVEFLDDE